MDKTGPQCSSVTCESGPCPSIPLSISFVSGSGERNQVYFTGIAAVFQVWLWCYGFLAIVVTNFPSFMYSISGVSVWFSERSQHLLCPPGWIFVSVKTVRHTWPWLLDFWGSFPSRGSVSKNQVIVQLPIFGSDSWAWAYNHWVEGLGKIPPHYQAMK